MSSQVRGGTRWKRFALVMVPSVVATAAVGVGLAQGALAASFSVSGQSFKVRADKLVGHDFVQYGSVATGMDPEGKNGAHAVAVSGFSDATITNMCQSVVTPNLPFGLGSVTLQLKAGTDPEKPVEATNLYLDVAEARRRRVLRAHRHRCRRGSHGQARHPGRYREGRQPQRLRAARQDGDADQREADGMGDHRRRPSSSAT